MWPCEILQCEHEQKCENVNKKPCVQVINVKMWTCENARMHEQSDNVTNVKMWQCEYIKKITCENVKNIVYTL